MTYEASKIWVLVLRGRKIYLLPTWERSFSISHGSQGQGQGYHDQGQDGAVSQAGQIICYLCRKPKHFRLDCPRRQESQCYGTPQS